MKKGFTEFAATVLIPQYPGQTAVRYAATYLEEVDERGSDAKDGCRSLANTLDKQVRTGREMRVRRERVDGEYRFFPVSASGGEREESIVVQLSLSRQQLEHVDNLVAVEKFKNRTDAIKWLIADGVSANHAYLSKVADRRRQIELLKKDL